MSISKRNIDDASGESTEITATTADDADLPSAEIPIAIGDPAVPGALPVSNLLEYLRDALASFITQGSNITVTHDDAANTLTIAATDTNTQRSDEEIRDLVAGFLTNGTNVTITHDDANDTLTIASTDTNTQRSDEEIRDLIAGFLTQGSNVTITHDDAGNTLTITATDTNTQRSDEDIRDVIAAFITQGTNVTVTHDDAGNTLTIAATGSGGLSAEEVRDTVAAFLTQGTNITLTHDDAGNTLTIAATGSGGLSAEEVRDTVAAFLTQGTNITLTHDDAGNTLTIAATLNIPADSVGLAELASGTPDALVSYNSSGNPVERYGLIPFTGHSVGTYQTVTGTPGSGQMQIVAAGTSVVLSHIDNAGTDQSSILSDDFNNKNYALVVVAGGVEYIFSITGKSNDTTNQRWTLSGTWIGGDGTSIAASTDCEVRIIKHNTDISAYMDTTPTLLWESTSGYSTTGTDEDLDTGNFTDYDWIYFYAQDQWDRKIGGFVPRTQFAIANETFRLATHEGHILPKYIDTNTFQIHAGTTGFDLLAIYGL